MTCETCDGEGTIEVDAYTPARGHHTVPMACPDCDGGRGDADDAALETALEGRRGGA